MKRFSKSHLFLIELMIVIFFFSLTSAVCVSLFAKSHMTSQASHELNEAMFLVQSGAECVKASDGRKTAILDVLSAQEVEPDVYEVSYDAGFQRTESQEDIQYIMTISVERSQPDLLQGTVVMAKQAGKDREEVYRLGVSKFLGQNP